MFDRLILFVRLPSFERLDQAREGKLEPEFEGLKRRNGGVTSVR